MNAAEGEYVPGETTQAACEQLVEHAWLRQAARSGTARSRRRAALCGEGGANLVEMALVLPVYFLLIFTLISFSIVLFAYCNATYASKAAVRYAIVHSATSVTPCTTASIQNLVAPFLWGAPTGGVTITTQWPNGNTVGGTVLVTVQLAYSTGMPYGYLNNLVVSTTAGGTILQ